MEHVVNRELGWDDVIENDGDQWVLLPEGDYAYKVAEFERARHAGSAKIPPCNKAIVTISVESPKGRANIKCNLLLHQVQEWKLCQFFTSIGQRRHGEQLRMNWSAVLGACGRCKVGVRKWTGDDGKEHENNEIIEFYEPDEIPAESPKFVPGAF